MSRLLRPSLCALCAVGCQYVTGLEDLEIVVSSDGAGPQGGAGVAGAHTGGGGMGGMLAGGFGGDGGTGGEGGTPIVTTAIGNFAGSNHVLSMAQNGAALFFSDNELGSGFGRIWRWEKSDPDADAEAIATGLNEPRNLWATATHLYWSTGSPPTQVMMAPLADLSASTLVESGNDIRDVEVDQAPSVLYADSVGVHAVGSALPLYAGTVGRFDARDATTIFVLTPDVVSVPKGGGPGTEIILQGGGKGGYVALASDATTVFAMGGSGFIERVDKDGSNVVANLALLNGISNDLAVDDVDDQIYVAMNGSIRRLPKNGGTDTTLETGSAPWRLLLDAEFIYWFDLSTSDVWRTTR